MRAKVGLNRWWATLPAITVLALAAVVVSPVGGTGAAGASSAPVPLTLYNGQHVQTTIALVDAFEHQTGIPVNVRSNDEDVFTNQILAEGGHSPADLFLTENSPPLESLGARGLLAPVARTTLAKVPQRYCSPRGDWVGVSARVSVMIYNTSLLRPSQLPKSVLDLAKPRWRGMLALAPAETDFQPIVTAVQRAKGTRATLQWLEGLKANAAGHIYPDNESVTDQVNRGQVALGLIDQYYWYRLRGVVGGGGMHSAVAFFAPHDPGYVVDVSGAAILATSHEKAEAQRFLAFLVSSRAQLIIARGTSYEYPIGSGVTAAHGEVPLASLQPDDVSAAQLGTGAGAVSLLQEVQLL